MSESGRQAMKKVKGANLEDGYFGEKHFRKKKKTKNSDFKSSEWESYGVFKHGKMCGVDGVEKRKSRMDVVRWIKGHRFSMYGMEFEF